jgi:hypothetical protein
MSTCQKRICPFQNLIVTVTTVEVADNNMHLALSKKQQQDIMLMKKHD